MQTGFVRYRLFLSDEIEGWGDTQYQRISQMLARVTNSTNFLRLRKQIRSEDVMQLALRRRLQTVRDRGAQMDAAQLREEMDQASRLVAEQAEWIKALEDDNAALESTFSDAKARLEDERENLKRQTFVIQSLKNQPLVIIRIIFRLTEAQQKPYSLRR